MRPRDGAAISQIMKSCVHFFFCQRCLLHLAALPVSLLVWIIFLISAPASSRLDTAHRLFHGLTSHFGSFPLHFVTSFVRNRLLARIKPGFGEVAEENQLGERQVRSCQICRTCHRILYYFTQHLIFSSSERDTWHIMEFMSVVCYLVKKFKRVSQEVFEERHV